MVGTGRYAVTRRQHKFPTATDRALRIDNDRPHQQEFIRLLYRNNISNEVANAADSVAANAFANALNDAAKDVAKDAAAIAAATDGEVSRDKFQSSIGSKPP